MKTQNRFTFSKFIQKTYPKGYMPARHISIEDEITEDMVKKGYLVKIIDRKETTTITCSLAKANVSMEERKKLQESL